MPDLELNYSPAGKLRTWYLKMRTSRHINRCSVDGIGIVKKKAGITPRLWLALPRITYRQT